MKVKRFGMNVAIVQLTLIGFAATHVLLALLALTALLSVLRRLRIDRLERENHRPRAQISGLQFAPSRVAVELASKPSAEFPLRYRHLTLSDQLVIEITPDNAPTRAKKDVQRIINHLSTV